MADEKDDTGVSSSNHPVYKAQLATMTQLPPCTSPSLPWYLHRFDLSPRPATPPQTAHLTPNDSISHDTLPPLTTVLTYKSVNGFSEVDALPAIETIRESPLEHTPYPPWFPTRGNGLFASESDSTTNPSAATRLQNLSSNIPNILGTSSILSNGSASPTLFRVPHPDILPYAIVSREQVFVTSSCSVSIGSPTSAAIESFPQYANSKAFSGNAFDRTGKAGAANLLSDDEGYDPDHSVELEAIENAGSTHCKHKNDLSSQSGAHEAVFACNANMTAATDGGHDCCSGALHSQTCLFSSSGPLRPLPSPKDVEVSARIDQERPATISRPLSLKSSLQSLYPPNSTQSSSRPLPQLRTPSYGVRTSHVRDLPRVPALDTQYAPQAGGTAIRMTNKALPPIQTILDRIPDPNYWANAVNSEDVNWKDQLCSKYLSYPSPSSSTDAIVHETSPLDSFLSFAGQRCHEFAGMDQARERRDGRTQAFIQTDQTTMAEPQHKNGKPIDATQKQSTVYNYPRRAARFREQRSISSSFTSSDIERASSIESYIKQGQDVEEPETTIFLRERWIASPGSASLISTVAQMAHFANAAESGRSSAPTTVESGSTSGYLSPSVSDFEPFSSAKAMRDLPSSAIAASKRPATLASTTSLYGNDSSGSDYEASVIKRKKAESELTKPKTDKTVGKSAAVTKILRQDRLYNEKATERVINKKKHKRAAQGKTSLSTVKERSFRCDFCPMAFHRRHDMKRHSRLHTGERPYKCPSKACNAAFERNDQLRRHIERTEECRKKAPSLEGHQFCQGAIKRKRR